MSVTYLPFISFTMLNNRLKEEVQAERATLKSELNVERERFLTLAKVEAALRVQHDSDANKLKSLESELIELKEKYSINDQAKVNLTVELKEAISQNQIDKLKITE